MTWITVLWPMVAGACIALGLIHIRIGLRTRLMAAHLLLAFTAFVFATFSGLELSLMLARSPARYLAILRWSDIVGAVGAMSLAAFVWVFFETGRKWLALLGSGLLLCSLTLNMLPEPKLVYLDVTAIRTVDTFGGASYAVAEGTRNPLVVVYYLGVLMIAAFVADAAVTLWRQGRQRRAALVGGTITFFILAAGVQTSLVDAGLIATPYHVSFFYLAILVAMGIDLSDEVVQASTLAYSLIESEQRLELAADAAHLGPWVWDIDRDEIWTTPQGRALFGFAEAERLDHHRILAVAHPHDRESVQQAVAESLLADADYEREFRIVLPDGGRRWIAVRGRVERDKAGRAVRVRGVAMDITRRKDAERAVRSLSGRLIGAQEAEKTRLARELHDDFNQRLALLAVELEMFGQKPPTASTAITGRMQEFSARVKEMSSAMHRLSHDLHPAKLEQLGLVAAVGGLCREFGAAHKIDIEFETHDVPRTLPDGAALCLYRVVQEGLQNVVRHSGADRAKVDLTANDYEIFLVLSDQGCGFDAASMTGGTSLGLISMRERVRLVQGHIAVQSRSGEGTRIKVQVPLCLPVEAGQP